MRCAIGHAIYGERDRGHELLAASPAFPDPKAIRGRMDLQGSPPPHGTWDPYLSGFAWEGAYILARTAPDRTAGRSGMVFSRAFALPLAEAVATDDIGGLLARLVTLDDTRTGIYDVDWTAADLPAAPTPALARALLAGGTRPLVWPGQTGFADAVASLWANLWPAARAGLSFRIAFSPQDVAAAPPTIVTVPEALVTRWSGHAVVRPPAGDEPEGEAEALLTGADGADALRSLVLSMAVTTPAIDDLLRVAEVGRLLRDGGDAGDLVDGLRLVCHLCPEPDRAEDEKTRLIALAAEAMARASAAQARMARNLDLAAIRSPEPFWAACEAWAGATLWREEDGKAIGATLEDALSDKPVREWRAAVTAGALDAIASRAAEVATPLWRAALPRPALLPALLERRRPGTRAERILAEAAPIDLGASGAALTAAAARLDLATLHAACCAGSLAPADAVRGQVGTFPNSGTDDILLAGRGATEEELVAIALAMDDRATLAVAADLCAADPSYLRAVDVADARWRELWKASLSREPDAWRGPSDPAVAMRTLMGLVTDGAIEADALLGELAATPLADLLDHPRRAELWARLPAASVERYLAATADAWVDALEAGSAPAAPEPELARALTAPTRLTPLLDRSARKPASGVALFRALPQLPQTELRRWIGAALGTGARVDAAAAEALGRLVAARGWDGAAGDLADAVLDRSRDDLRPSLAYVVDMIGMVRRFRLDMLGQNPPAVAKWRILEEVAIELYGWGPGQDGLWERAGGRQGDIPKADTGAEAWRMVIARATKGKADIAIRRLIETMADDYPANPTVRKMRWDPLFAGGA